MHSPQDPELAVAKPAQDDRRESDFGDTEPPRILLRDVAASLRSLSKILPYEEYATIVHRIARVRWQCEQIKSERRTELPKELRADAADDGRFGPLKDESLVRLWDAAIAYSTRLELATESAELIARARRARLEAQESRARVVADRDRRSAHSDARASLRDAVRVYVIQLKSRGDSLDDVLRSTGTVLSTLRASGSLSDDMGSFEVEVQRIVAEEYCSAA